MEWTIWQLTDSALPIGGFAHSSGLEAAFAAGSVTRESVESLIHFIQSTLANIASLQLPIMEQMWASEAKVEEWERADSLMEALLTTQAARRASAAQGQALLRLAVEAFPDCEGISEVRAFRMRMVAQGEGKHLHGHFSPTLSFLCLCQGVDLLKAQRMLLFISARGMLSAANRLSIVGPLQGAQLLHRLQGYVEQLLDVEPRKEVYQTDPLLELLQGTHDKLYSRLFNS
ncbi:unnamed protein product [Chrysoparadoxa australica]